MRGLARVARVWQALRTLYRIAPAHPLALVPTLAEYALLRIRLRSARVKGYCPTAEGLVLFWLARFSRPNDPLVEIGSAWGLSTIVLACGSRGRVVTVDTHRGEGMSEPEDSYAAFLANVARFGVSDRVEAHRATSAELASRYDSERAALLYVDGLHTYEGVASDIENWLPKLRAGALVIFDDYGDPTFEVRQAVDDAVEAGRLDFVATPFGLAVARRPA